MQYVMHFKQGNEESMRMIRTNYNHDGFHFDRVLLVSSTI